MSGQERSQSPEMSDSSVRVALINLLAAHARSNSRSSAIAQLFGSGRITFVGEDDDEEDADYMDNDSDENEDWRDDPSYMDDEPYGASRPQKLWTAPPTTPQDAGVELIKSGEFGRVSPKIRARRGHNNLAKVISNRLSRPHPALYKEDYASSIVPNSNGVVVANYDSNIYTAQFSKDSSFFYTCSQDFRLNLFDTTAAPIPHKPRKRTNSLGFDLKTTMKLNRSIQGEHGRWTITDANLSPNNERIVYSSITSTAYMCSTIDDDPTQIPIPFHDHPARNRLDDWHTGVGSLALYSCRFSADGNEIIAGGRGEIFVYDLLANKRSVKISAHEDDVNSCTWADTASGNVLVSASDDNTLKVWDRRSLGASQEPSGVLVGHTEGITYVSAKGDGRYVLSNGKDQAMRLWDLRKMRTKAEYDSYPRHRYSLPNFDYRYPNYPKPKFQAHPGDCSVMTYRGHSVLITLIRCHFSPAETTGGQYVYSGSADGRVHIWSLDGTVVDVLDRSKTLAMNFDPSGLEFPRNTSPSRSNCVRDVSWHSEQPVMISAAWESLRLGSTLARHEWKGLSKMANSLPDWNQKEEEEKAELERRSVRRSPRLNRRYRLMPGNYDDGDDDDEQGDDEDYVE
ncbi:WD40 repeat-like protein [Dendrothele bispora CBS 962.96]|uniref:WD40 repeat-like protein n=1 Tax=Dendrothele bispora (strain CBS 962.96) TaxID=1314807 RepID=A0A4S8MFM1_DENBC|nr:WD40 repeat-like protein [Dendrothele bispora CBS 962.96]